MFFLKFHHSAQETQNLLSGTIMIRAMGIGSPQSMQMPKSSLSMPAKAYFSLASLVRADARFASLMLLLPIASMRDKRPTALSGEIGLVSSSRVAMSFSAATIAAWIRYLTSIFSAGSIESFF
jgi:hypothetical protein